MRKDGVSGSMAFLLAITHNSAILASKTIAQLPARSKA
jgi:hypothetical protein